MDKKEIQIRRSEPVHIRSIVKTIMMDLYSRAILPKKTTQKLYNFLNLKEH